MTTPATVKGRKPGALARPTITAERCESLAALLESMTTAQLLDPANRRGVELIRQLIEWRRDPATQEKRDRINAKSATMPSKAGQYTGAGRGRKKATTGADIFN